MITAAGELRDAIAIGDGFFHRGCIEAAPASQSIDTPAYFIPRDW